MRFFAVSSLLLAATTLATPSKRVEFTSEQIHAITSKVVADAQATHPDVGRLLVSSLGITKRQEEPDLGAVTDWLSALVSAVITDLETLPGHVGGLLGAHPKRQEEPDLGALSDYVELITEAVVTTVVTLPNHLGGLLGAKPN